jgi:hypothetical protein
VLIVCRFESQLFHCGTSTTYYQKISSVDGETSGGVPDHASIKDAAVAEAVSKMSES